MQMQEWVLGNGTIMAIHQRYNGVVIAGMDFNTLNHLSNNYEKTPLSPGAFFLNKIQLQTLIKQEQ